MNTAIIFLSIFILVISLMLEIKVDINFDLWANKLIIKIYLFNIRIIQIKVFIIGFYYQINNSKKLKKLNLFLTKEEEYLIIQIKKSVIDKLYYDKLELSGDLGLKSASDTAILSGIIYMLCSVFENILKLKNTDSEFEYSVSQNYVNRVIAFHFSAKVYFTIFDLIFAVILSFYKRGKYAKQRQKEGQH